MCVSDSPNHPKVGKIILQCVVLAILLCAPIGSVIVGKFGPRLLGGSDADSETQRRKGDEEREIAALANGEGGEPASGV